eukprot:GGOE01008628.1.p3 GENE.GGOE01008628.1~~GGOE01008628.1.p3  ORF type:complete len:137 (-),score=12.55 GGOE01008628.1:956-1366(-)
MGCQSSTTTVRPYGDSLRLVKRAPGLWIEEAHQRPPRAPHILIAPPSPSVCSTSRRPTLKLQSLSAIPWVTDGLSTKLEGVSPEVIMTTDGSVYDWGVSPRDQRGGAIPHRVDADGLLSVPRPLFPPTRPWNMEPL